MSDWNERTLGKFAAIQTGPFGSQLHAHDYVPVGIPSIMPKNIGSRLNPNTEDIAQISIEIAERLGKYRVRPTDIGYSRRGDVEKCAFITESEDGWLCGTGCIRVRLSKEIVKSDAEAKNLGLTDFEYTFYTAVANNDIARQLMQQDKLRELAVVLTQKVRENASIDWTIKESVRAKLKVIVKRILRQFGYPPDMQLLATETVLKQAEMIADELAGTGGID